MSFILIDISKVVSCVYIPRSRPRGCVYVYISK